MVEGILVQVFTLLDKVERKLIPDEDFQPRYKKIKNELSELSNERARLNTLENLSLLAFDSLKSSFEEIFSFKHNWEYLDDIGRSLR